MVKRKPAIAIRRQEEALQKFSRKLEILGNLLAAGTLDPIPPRMRPSTFVAWEDETLCIQKISRNLLYETSDEYLRLHRRLDSLLADLGKARAKGTKKEDRTSKLVADLEAAERRAQIYVNEYSAAMAELQEKVVQIASLERQLARVRENSKKVSPLHVLKPSDATDE